MHPGTRHLFLIDSPNAIRFEAHLSQLTMSPAAPQDAIAGQAQAQASASKKKKNKKNKAKKNLDPISNSNDGVGIADEPEPSPRDGINNDKNNLSADDDEPDTPVVSKHQTHNRKEDPLSPGLADARLPGQMGYSGPRHTPDGAPSHGHGQLVRKCDLLSLICLDRPKSPLVTQQEKTPKSRQAVVLLPR